jgi:hypothetical protein
MTVPWLNGARARKVPNCLPIVKDWNYTVRRYRPRRNPQRHMEIPGAAAGETERARHTNISAHGPISEVDCASQQSGNVDLCGKPPAFVHTVPELVVGIDVGPTPPPRQFFSIVSNFEQWRL